MIQYGQLYYAVNQCNTMKIRCFGKKNSLREKNIVQKN